MSTMTRMAGLSQLDPFFLDADSYARSIENVPLNWWPQCVEHGIGVTRRLMEASAEMVCIGIRYEVKMRVDLPIGLVSVDMNCPVDRRLPVKKAVDTALAEMKGFFLERFLERLEPKAAGCLVVWDERKCDER